MSKARNLAALLGGGSTGVVEFSGTGAVKVPGGTSAQRPTPANGQIRYNSDVNSVEVYANSAWAAISPPPTIQSVSPTTYNGEQGTTFTLTGANFNPDATVKFVTNNGTEFTAATVTRVSSTQITATTPQDYTVAQEPLSIKVVQGSGSVSLESAIDCGGTPTWTTSAGSLGTCYDSMREGFYADVVATDPDSGATVTYAVTSGSLPSGMALNSSTGRISGTPNAVVSDTTANFTVTATDNAGNSTQRAFSLTIKAPVVVSYTVSGLSTFSVPSTTFEVLAVGAGGGAGGSDGNTAGNAGASGGAVYAKYSFSSAKELSVFVGGGGQSGLDECGNMSSGHGASFGEGGYNGGGNGGRAGTSPCSGSGGGGGGWSGIYIDSVPYLIAGGGGGGGGGNEGDANELAPRGGGYQPDGANGTSMVGGTGASFSGDGGGYGGGGGGFYGGLGSAAGRSSNGGGHYTNSLGRVSFTVINGNDGPASPNTTGAASVIAPNASLFNYDNTAGKGANGATGNGSRGATGGTGALFIKY